MTERQLVARYAALLLGVVAGLEWLLGRALSRLAASPALEGTPRTIIEILGSVGLFLFAPAFLLASAVLLLSVFHLGVPAMKNRLVVQLALVFFLVFFLLFCLVYPLLGRDPWAAAGLNALTLIAVLWLAFIRPPDIEPAPAIRSTVVLAALGWGGYLLYVAYQQLSAGGGAGLLLRDLGEMVAVAAPYFLFGAVAVPGGEWARPRRWIFPVAAALIFAGGNIADMAANQGFTGVMTIWSVGFSFFLPWPVYALSLALYLYAIMTCFSGGTGGTGAATPDRGLGALLLLFASFELQFPYQHVLAVLSLLLLLGLATPLGGQKLSPLQEEQTLGRPVEVLGGGSPGVTPH